MEGELFDDPTAAEPYFEPQVGGEHYDITDPLVSDLAPVTDHDDITDPLASDLAPATDHDDATDPSPITDHFPTIDTHIVDPLPNPETMAKDASVTGTVAAAGGTLAWWAWRGRKRS
jgi:hypothetical protein